VSQLTVEVQNETSSGCSKITLTLNGLPRSMPNRIFYEIVGPDAPQQEPNGNFAIAAALPAAMAQGSSLHYHGDADSDFLTTVEEYMAAWCRWLPDRFRPVAVTADMEAIRPPPQGRRAIMAFSGGLDSTFALHAHKRNLLGRRGLDIQAAVLIQGFDLTLDDQKAFDKARRHVERILASYGVRLNVVRTNWKKVAVNWQMTHVLGIAAILHQFHRSFDHGVFADDVPYDKQVTPWSSNAITNQMLGSAGFPIRSTGASWYRTEKAAILGTNPVVLDHIRVCYARPDLGENCGGCEKCLRTKLNFRAAGVHCVPALGNPVSVDDVRRANIPLGSANLLVSYVDLLEKGSWDASDPMYSEVEALVRRSFVGTTVAASRTKKRQRSIYQRMKKSLGRMSYSLRSIRY
jgi:7-cyano-7-deazaguanine synthase in queuosine biosynthesis